MFTTNSTEKLLKENGIPFKRDVEVGDYKYDFLIGDTLLNVVPYKDSVFDEENGTLDDKKRYIKESNNVMDTEYECIHWYEHYDTDKMIDFLKSKSNANPTKKLYGRKLKVKEVDPKEAKDFIDENHLLGLNKKSVYNLGLYDGDELVSCMAFSPVIKNKTNKKLFGVEDLSDHWELIRFCSKANYGVVGGANKLFKEFLREKDPKGIMTYSDYNLGKGSIYTTLGFDIAKKPGVNCYWSHPKDTKLFINDNLVRNGTDRILPNYEEEFGYKYFKLGMDYNKFIQNGGKKVWGDWWKEHKDVPMSEDHWPSNIDNMLFYGFKRIFDNGYTTFVWFPKKDEVA